MERTLYGLGQSPWTERARWALAHHGIAYVYHEHVPMLGEVLLRAKARRAKATVPLFVDGGAVVMGSVDVMRHAERIGRGAPLFPAGAEDEIAHWVDVAERMLEVGRAWLMRRLLASKEAQAEALPSFIPRSVRRACTPMAVLGTRFIARKYGVAEDASREVEETLRPRLEAIRGRVGRETKTEGPSHLLDAGGFSAADLVIASSLQVVEPRAGGALGPATREAWTNPALAKEFPDLLAWRDAIYARHGAASEADRGP